MKNLLFLVLWLILPATSFAQTKGVLLAELTWQEAEKRLKPDTVIVIPLGAEAKEHGPHLKLKNDWTMAEYFKQRVLIANGLGPRPPGCTGVSVSELPCVLTGQA